MRFLALLAALATTACGGGDHGPGFGRDAGPDAGPSGGGGTSDAAGGRAGAVGGGGTGGARPEAGVAGAGGVLGSECTRDDDCGTAMVCLTSNGNDVLGGGPAHGMCAADCAQAPDVCSDIDPTSYCVRLDDGGTPSNLADDTAFCFSGCPMGGSIDPASKCLGRADVSCAPSSAPPIGFCLPSCRNDDDCAPRVCDIGSGVCKDAPTGTLPVGSPCTASAQCDGLCLDMGPSYSVCSGVCRIGEDGCGESGSLPLDSACLLAQATGVSYLGDAGYCVQLCDCNGDCNSPDAVCEDLSLQSVTGRAGMCFPADRGGDAGRATGSPCTSDAGGRVDASPAPPDLGPTGPGTPDAAVSDASADATTQTATDATTD